MGFKVSIIIPFKKDRGYLNEAIKSVENQTYNNIELILSESNNSVGYNFNKGLERSSGELICYLCDDDLLPPDSIEKRVDGMKDFDFIHSKGEYLYPNGVTKPYKLINPYAQFNSVLQSNGIMGGSTMYRADMLKLNPLREDLWTCEEWELHLRLLKQGYKIGFLDEITYIYRRHPEQKSIGNISNEYQAKRSEQREEIRSWYK